MWVQFLVCVGITLRRTMENTVPTRTGDITYEMEVSQPMRRTGPNGSQYDVTEDEYSEQHHDEANVIVRIR